MSQAFYSGVASEARAQLTKFGQIVTLRTQPAGAYDPDAGSASAGTPVDKKRKGAAFDFEEGLREESGTLIEAGDKKLLMEAGVKPNTSDQIILANGDIYEIVNIGEVNPAGTVVLYILHLRKA